MDERTVIVNCPVCKARNDGGFDCRRCRADLELLFRLERQRSRLLSIARHQLRAGDWSGALQSARAAVGIRADDDAVRVHAAAALMQGSHDKFLKLVASVTNH